MYSFKGKKSTLFTSAVLALHLASCTPDPRAIILIDSIDAIGPDGEPVGELYSDVCAGPPPGCVAVNDNALVTMSARVEDPFKHVAKFGDITIERYRVTYIRSDGRNVPGVEVPFGFDAAANFRVPVDSTVTHQIMVVRPQAKLEPPLRNLAFNGGAIAISVTAQIDFFGTDTQGRQHAVQGALDITFADFANE